MNESDIFACKVEEAIAERGIVDCTSGTPVVRKVLGELARTEDGVIIARTDEIHYLYEIRDGSVNEVVITSGCDFVGTYSTEALALAAIPKVTP